jgi:hypothetical protein
VVSLALLVAFLRTMWSEAEATADVPKVDRDARADGQSASLGSSHQRG